jgi:hypothetical protein
MKKATLEFEFDIPVLLLKDGYLKLDVCKEGGSRLLESFGVIPGISVEINPANNLLKVKCYCIERGGHSISIVDLSGSTAIVKN